MGLMNQRNSRCNPASLGQITCEHVSRPGNMAVKGVDTSETFRETHGDEMQEPSLHRLTCL